MGVRTANVIAGFGAAIACIVAVPATASAATTTLYLSSNVMPVSVSVNGKGVPVDGGESGYDPAAVKVAAGSVSLSAQAKANLGANICYGSSSWSDGNSSRNRTVAVTGDKSLTAYYSRTAC